MTDNTNNPLSTSGLEFLLYFVGGWSFGALYYWCSSAAPQSYPWTAASFVVLAATLPLAWSAGSLPLAVLRSGAPLAILILFSMRTGAGQSALERLQNGIAAPHFLFLFAVTFFAVQYSPAKKTQRASQKPAAPAPRPAPRKAEAKPDVHAFDRLVGQPEAVNSLKEIANVVRSGIRVGKRNAPHSVLLFLGPTGVGKTEAARALAHAVYGSEDALIRFDMGQFTDAHQANRFYGPPPGYVGSDKGGQLTQAVLRKPKSVVLLDEVEKADPQIWDAFLPVFDEGYIVDGSTNQKVDMTNTIIVLTSNLLAGTVGVDQLNPAELKDAVRDTGAFRPELVGRINEVLVFKPLGNETIAEILRRRVDASLWSLADQGVAIEIDDRDIAEMVANVKEAKYGVRQIDDVVRTFLRKAIAEKQGEPTIED